MGDGGKWATPLAVLLAIAFSVWLLTPRGGEGALALVRAGYAQPRVGDTISRAADDAAAGGTAVSGGLFGWVGGLFGGGGSGRELAALRAENEALQRWKLRALQLAERTQRYEALLRMPPEAFGEDVSLEGLVSARLVLDSDTAFRRTLLANAGAEQGVRLGFLALNEYGLVGRVVAVGRRSARVLMLDDYNSRVPVVGEQSRVRAIMTGDLGRRAELGDGQGAGSAQLRFSVGASSLRQQERIITSGDGGLYPRGVFVGWAEQASNGAWRVRLATSSGPVDYVRLAPFAPPPAPEVEAAPAVGPRTLLQAAVSRAPAAAAPPAAAPAARPNASTPSAPPPPLPSQQPISPEAAAAGVPEE
jgi:rod shape-determining protein MreC